jgi:uncharacterized protein
VTTRQLPVVGRDTAFFWAGARRHELLAQRCAGCGEVRHPPRPICPSCHSFDWVADSLPGTGTVHSFVVHHHPPIPGFTTPVVLVLVDVDGGVRMAGQLLDVDPDDVHIGQAVEVAFEDVAEDVVLPQWRVAGGGR